MNALLGVLIGGAISLATTLAVDFVRGRRDMRHRWDDEALAAVSDFIEIGNRTIGALYDEGRARAEQPNNDDKVAEIDRAARAQMDAFRVAHARARLVMRPLELELAGYQAALGQLKQLADGGFAPQDERWKQCQGELRGQLDLLIAKAAATLRFRET